MAADPNSGFENIDVDEMPAEPEPEEPFEGPDSPAGNVDIDDVDKAGAVYDALRGLDENQDGSKTTRHDFVLDANIIAGLGIDTWDNSRWITTKNGKHIQIDDETGEVLKGNIGPREKAIQDKIDSIVVKRGENSVLPGLNEETLQALGKKDKPVLLKSNIIEKNLNSHPEVDIDDFKQIIGQSLYRPDTIATGANPKYPSYVNFISRIGQGKSSVVLLELEETKDNYEIVNMHWLHNNGVARKEKKGVLWKKS